ncbi:MAG: M48 family metalloprotease [Desulfobulbus sp.]|nr:M48 family metalloprotease [Desulfobulbus sp.]
MSRDSFFFRWVALVALVLCLTWPVQASSFTIGEERKIGEYLLYSMRKELSTLDDPDISQYINNLGARVLENIGPQHFDYHFFVVKSDQFNAFAAPAGLVFFYTGLIETMKTEDQLLSVLAHEIGHVVSRHIAQRLEKSSKISALSLILGAAGLALGVPGLSQGLLTGSMAAGQTLNLKYSREDEEQADRLAFGWMQRMQRDPEAMREMLQTMRRITRYQIGPGTPQYLLTHPDPEARLGYVESLIEVDQQRQKPQAYVQTNNFAFLRFKYRVLVQSADPDRLRTSCVTLMNSAKEAEQRHMARYGLALLDARDHKYEQALQHLARVHEQYPHESILDVDRAVILLQNGRYNEARPVLEQAVKRDPTDLYGVYQLGKLESMSGNFPKARQLLLRVAAMMPEYAQLYFDLGQLEANSGREGVSVFYLAKYNLYRGNIKTAKQYFMRAAKDTTIPENMRSEAKQTVEKLDELEKEM